MKIETERLPANHRVGPCVAFVVQRVETFEIVAPVVRALRAAGWRAAIVVTPERLGPFGQDRLHHRPRGGLLLRLIRRTSRGRALLRSLAALRNEAGTDAAYDFELARLTWKSLESDGFAPEPLLEVDMEADRLRELRPTAVFLPTPYESERHPSLSPWRLDLPVHYVNYGFNVNVADRAIDFSLPFFSKCDAIYSENAFCSTQYELAGIDRSRIIDSGSPVLDYWDTERPRAEVPTVLWCPHWSVWAGDETPGYSTFLMSYRAVLEEATRRPDVRFIIRPHPGLWGQLRREALWTSEEETAFHETVDDLRNVTIEGIIDTDGYPFYSSHIEQFARAWAMVTDGISFLAEFGYTGKPLLLTEAPNNPGWNPVGQAIADVVRRSAGAEGLRSFLDDVERDIDDRADERSAAIRRLFFRPPGGSAAVIVQHLERVAEQRAGA